MKKNCLVQTVFVGKVECSVNIWYSISLFVAERENHNIPKKRIQYS